MATLLLAIVIASAIGSWMKFEPLVQAQQFGQVYPWVVGASIIGLVLSLVVGFAPKTAAYLAPIYAAAEGIFLEIGETGGSVVAFFAWFTYDQTGRPYWLVGQAAVPPGTRTVSIPTQYYSGGGFAGNFTAATGQSWGTVTMTFPSCNALTLQFESGTVPAGIPSGSGTRSWSRLLNIEGYACE